MTGTLRFQDFQRSGIVRFVGNFIHQLAEDDVVIFIQNDDRTRGQTFQRAFGDFNAVVFQEFSVTQRGQRDNVAQTFSATEAGLGKRQIGRNTQHHGIVDFGGQLVKLTYRCGANAGIDARENVQDFAFASKLAQCDVRQIFCHEGKRLRFAIQDASAQGCVAFLAPQNGEHILDLCAAPGGKTTHILEAAPEANVLAVDVDEQRLSRVYDNLKRLGMKATVKQGDGRFPAQWCGEQQFDRILLDAPCSATGVIRRHPDIKWLRRDRDITELAKLQAEILDAVWPHLKSGGTLVYATCSVLPEENSQQVHAFLQRTTDAMLSETGTPEMPGLQNLPGAEDGDGFFYAKLIKK